MADSSPHNCDSKGARSGECAVWRRQSDSSLVVLAGNCKAVDLVVACEKTAFVLIWLVESCKAVDMWQASSL